MASAAPRFLVALLLLGVPGSASAVPIAFLVAEKPGEVTHGDSYVLVLEADADIEHARALIADLDAVEERIVVASIAPGADGVNRDHRASGAPEWSWHLTAFTEFAGTTIELCDGWPSFVEEDVAGWIQNTGGPICFWSYTVVEELGPVPEPGQAALLGVGAALLAALGLKRSRRVRDILGVMPGRLRVAVLLLGIFALQAGASAVASAAGPDCCPAMATAAAEAPAPCRSLVAMGCCEERTGAASAEVFVPPAHALVAHCSATPSCAAPRALRLASARPELATRALCGTILRL